MNEYQAEGLVPEQARSITGALQVSVDGTIKPKSPIEVLSVAKQTTFNERGASEVRFDTGCTIRYTPAKARPGAARLALADGVLAYKLRVEGKPPPHINLDEGSYYFFVQYVNGRWIGVAVDEMARARCLTFGVIVRQVFSVHPDAEHRTDSVVVPHKLASAEEINHFGPGLLAAAADWVDVQIGWEPFGAGCWKDIVCVPGT